MLLDYWPSADEIDRCIRTEAEELAEHVLLAVHEPIVIVRRQPGDPAGKVMNEGDLLAHLLRVERPIPIIGESGIGKSHLIRWLEAKLKVHPDAKNWHIRRIPKNAGLRGVLELLLDGLEGEHFESLREKISRVGDRLSEGQVVGFLLVAMGHRLEKLADDAQSEAKALLGSGQEIAPDKKMRLQLLQRHATAGKLPTLLNDPFFNSFLKDPESGCVFQIARRLTGQSTSAEVGRHDYKITPEDLNFNLQLSELSGPARTYVQQAMLNTSAARRDEATALLNEIINDACRETFYNFFQFNSGSFQDLFAGIRKYLHAEGKTLVLLVEDMAAISAIEDVLIDSLITESIRDGEQLLCPIRSALAVTEGYVGYQRRRDTLATRAQYEWYLPNRANDDSETLERIECLCGRYLNAARIGEEKLKSTYNPVGDEEKWPSVWSSSDPEHRKLGEAFGLTDDGISLFPFSKRAIAALANDYCRVNQELAFNPRTVLHHILRNILIYYRQDFEQGTFPSGPIGNTECPGALANELASEHLSKPQQAERFAALWGWGSRTLRELAVNVPTGLPQEFQLDDLADLLDRVRVKRGPDEPPKPRPPQAIDRPTPKPVPPVGGVGPSEEPSIPERVDDWFKREVIPQQEANLIRATLVRDLKAYADTASGWWGIMRLPPLIRAQRPLVVIPFNPNNPKFGVSLAFGSEEEFRRNPVRYKGVITAILRQIHFGGWDAYPEGYDDLCRYRAFLAEWIPEQMARIIASEREAAAEAYSRQGNLAVLVQPGIVQLSRVEKLAVLATPAQKMLDDYEPTGIAEWDQLVKNALDEWESTRQQWLPWYCPRRGRAIEGDLVKSKTGSSALMLPDRDRATISRILTKLRERYGPICRLFTKCSTKEEFKQSLTALREVVELLRVQDEYKGMEGELSSRKLLNRIAKVIESDVWPSVRALLKSSEPEAHWSAIRDLRLEQLDLIYQISATWEILYQRNFSRITDANNAAGAESRERTREELEGLLQSIQQNLDGSRCNP